MHEYNYKEKKLHNGANKNNMTEITKEIEKMEQMGNEKKGAILQESDKPSKELSQRYVNL